MKGRHEEKKNGNKPDVEKILLVTVILELVRAIVELVKTLID